MVAASLARMGRAGIGFGVVGAAGLAVGFSSPMTAAVVIGTAAIGGIAVALSRRCAGLRGRAEAPVREAAPVQEAAGFRFVLDEEELDLAAPGPQNNQWQNDGFDAEQLDAALAASLEGKFDYSFDEKVQPNNDREGLTAALAASRREQKYDPASSGYKCAVEMMLGGIGHGDAEEIMGLDNIPQNFLLFLGSEPIHAGHLVLYSLAHPEPKDHQRRPLTEETFVELAQTMGVDPDEFMSIWTIAQTNNALQGIQVDPATGEVTDITADNQRKDRFKQLHDLLSSERGTRGQITARMNFLIFLQTQDPWKRQFPNG